MKKCLYTLIRLGKWFWRHTIEIVAGIFALTCVMGWWYYPLIVKSKIVSINECKETERILAAMGQHGDTFGGLTSLFTVLAFIGVVVSVVYQRKQLDAQREKDRIERMPNPYVDKVFPFLLGVYNDKFLVGVAFDMRCPTEASILNFAYKVRVDTKDGEIFVNTSREIGKFLGKRQACIGICVLSTTKEKGLSFLTSLENGESISMHIDCAFCNDYNTAYYKKEEYAITSELACMRVGNGEIDDSFDGFGYGLGIEDGTVNRITDWLSKKEIGDYFHRDYALNVRFKANNPIPMEIGRAEYEQWLARIDKEYDEITIDDWDPNNMEIHVVQS